MIKLKLESSLTMKSASNFKKWIFPKLSVGNYVQLCVGITVFIVVASGCVVAFIKTDSAAWIGSITTFASLIFAMVVGYYAFDEFRRVKKEEYKKEANNFLLELKEASFKKALDSYQAAYEFGAKDLSTLKNMSELYSMTGDFNQARKIIFEAQQPGMETQDSVIIHYLMIISYLGEKDYENTKKEIKSLIQLIKGSAREKYNWNFKQIEVKMTKLFDVKGKKIYNLLKKLISGEISSDEFSQKVSSISWLD